MDDFGLDLDADAIAAAETATEDALKLAEEKKQEEAEKFELLKKAASALVNTAYEDERPARDVMIRKYKFINLAWTGSQYNVWDEGAADYIPISEVPKEILDDLEIDPSAYNRPVNILRAWGESIVGALTTSIPTIIFEPERASVVEDIETARAYTDISTLIDVHNKAKDLLERIVTGLFKHGFVAAYNYVHEDKKYGTVERDVYGRGLVADKKTFCPECNKVHGEETIELSDSEAETDETETAEAEGVLNSDVEPTDLNQQTIDEFICGCGYKGKAEEISDPYEDVVVTGTEEVPKRRVVIEIYDPLSITIPQNATSQKDVGYLINDTEIHYSLAKALYPAISKKIKPGGSAGDSTYDRYARASTEFGGNYASYVVTLRRTWLRPWFYHSICNNDEEFKIMQETFPRGCRITMVDEEVAEIVEDDIDECWTLSFNPLNNRILDYSIAMGAIPIQEMFSEMINLIITTIQYGIPEQYADPEFFSFEKYKKSGGSAGLVFPVKRPKGEALSNVITQSKPTTVPKDAVEFVNRLEQLGQMVTGAFPSIFGGPAVAGSKTFGEYEQSKNQALQRLSLLWKMTVSLWTDVKAKSVRMFKDAMISDETFVQNLGQQGFVDVEIKREMLTGKVGRVLPESSEQFPVSWAQRKSVLENLIAQKFEPMIAIMQLPENVGYVKDTLGLKDLYIPGDDDRTNQLKEISELLKAGPIPGVDPMTLQPRMESTVPIEVGLDDHQIHSDTISVFLKSNVGQYMKVNNPEGYQNVLAHKAMHDVEVQKAMMAEMKMQKEMNSDGNNKESKETNEEETPQITGIM